MALLVTLQERLVFVPVVPGLTNSFPITPARLRLNYEDVSLRSSDGIRLHAWFFLDFRGSIRFPNSSYSIFIFRLLVFFLFFFADLRFLLNSKMTLGLLMRIMRLPTLSKTQLVNIQIQLDCCTLFNFVLWVYDHVKFWVRWY